MKLNPTFLEITLTFLVSLSVYLWVKHGKRLVSWWQEMHTRHRRPVLWGSKNQSALNNP
jgi:hypothetical protein